MSVLFDVFQDNKIKKKECCTNIIHSSVIVWFSRNEHPFSWKMSNEKPLPISFGVFGKKEGGKKWTQTKSYPYISQLSFWQKSTLTKRTLTDELPKNTKAMLSSPLRRYHPSLLAASVLGRGFVIKQQTSDWGGCCFRLANYHLRRQDLSFLRRQT